MLKLPSVKLQDVLDLKGIDKIFQQLVGVINKQQGEIKELSKKFESVSTYPQQQQKTNRSIHNILSRLEVIESELQIKTSSSVEKENMKRTASLPATLEMLSLRLSGVESSVKTKLSTKDAQDHILDIQSRSNDVIRQIRASVASSSLVSNIQQSQDQMLNQIRALEAVVECKADRTQLSLLDSTAHKISNFAENYETLHSSVNALSSGLEESNASLELNATLAMETSTEITKLKKTLEKKAEKKEVQMHWSQFQNYMTSSQERKDMIQVVQKFPTVQRALLVLKKHLSSLEESTCTKLSTASENLKNFLQECLEKKLNIDDFNTKFRTLERTVETKASEENCANNSTRLSELAIKSDAIDRQAQLAVRFINWFSDRGEAYEHNFRVMEQRLGAGGKEDQPYDLNTRVDKTP